MGRKGILLIPTALAALTLACDSAPFLAPRQTLTSTPTSTITETPTLASTPTLTPYPTRTDSPTLIPGIEEPVSVEEANLLIIKVLRRDTFRCEEKSYSIDNPDTEEFLILLVKIVKGPAVTLQGFEDWIDENGMDALELKSSTRDSTGLARYCPSRAKETFVLTQIDIAFVVDLDAEGFILVLPDGTNIPLDSFFP